MDYGGNHETFTNCKTSKLILACVSSSIRCWTMPTLSFGAPWFWTTQSPLLDFMQFPQPLLSLWTKVVWWTFGQKRISLLKVLRSHLWVCIPPLEGVPHRLWPKLETTLLVDDNPTKSVLNPTNNVGFPNTWANNKKKNLLSQSLCSIP